MTKLFLLYPKELKQNCLTEAPIKEAKLKIKSIEEEKIETILRFITTIPNQ